MHLLLFSKSCQQGDVVVLAGSAVVVGAMLDGVTTVVMVTTKSGTVNIDHSAVEAPMKMPRRARDRCMMALLRPRAGEWR